MLNRHSKVHLEIQTSRKSPVGIIRSTYWCKESKKVKHRQFGRIIGKSLEELKAIQSAMRGQATSQANETFKIVQSKEFGATAAVRSIIKQIQLDKAIYSRKEQWVENVLAMIAGKLVFSSSKLGLCNLHESSSVWEQAGHHQRPDVDRHCYRAMDQLLGRQTAIQKKLIGRHEKDARIILYDITSTYFEGDYKDSQIVRYGYNRDRIQGKKQVVVGLICNAQGCPLALEVFAGNTKDETTVIDKIEQLRNTYALQKILFVGDRGMLTQMNLHKCKNDPDLQTITALTHDSLKGLVNRQVADLELFDQRNIYQVIDPQDPNVRYCICYNPFREQENRSTRTRLIDRTEQALEKISNYSQKTTVEILGARIGKILSKYKMGKFLTWNVQAGAEKKSTQHQVVWEWKQEKIEQEAIFDGYFAIRTDVDESEMAEETVLSMYKSLSQVEQAFRNLKHASIEVRPIYHHRDDRIRSHLFLCMLCYHVQWHMVQKLAPLFEKDGAGDQRQWSLESIFECLKYLTVNTIESGESTFSMISTPTGNQKQILDLLGIQNIATIMKSLN